MVKGCMEIMFDMIDTVFLLGSLNIMSIIEDTPENFKARWTQV